MSDQVRAFLDQLFPAIPSGMRLLIWSRPAKRSYWCEDTGEAASRAHALCKAGEDVYFGVGLAGRNYGPEKRCPAAEIAAIPGLWADFDVAGPAHADGKTYAPSREAILEMLENEDLTPTLANDSGHGLHVYNQFPELWVFNDDGEREAAAALAERWCRTVQAKAEERGWSVDSTYDLARVLRIPGTLNRKVDSAPAPVISLPLRGPLCQRETLSPRLAPPGAVSARRSEGSTAIVTEDLILAPNAAMDGELFALLCEVEPRFLASWKHERKDLKDRSLSSYDMSLATLAALAGWTDQQIANLLIHHRRKYGGDLKLRESYYRNTIFKAREPQIRAVATEALDQRATEIAIARAEQAAVMECPGADEKQEDPARERKRQSDLAWLGKFFGIEIRNLVRISSNPPAYTMETIDPDGSPCMVILGGVENLIDPHAFRRHFAATTGHDIGFYKRENWLKVSQVLLNACEHRDPGDESTDIGALNGWLDIYLSEESVKDGCTQDVVRAQSPYVEDGRVHIFGGNFRTWLFTNMGERVDGKRMGVLLRMSGAAPIKVNTFCNNKKTSRSVWILHEKFQIIQNSEVTEG